MMHLIIITQKPIIKENIERSFKVYNKYDLKEFIVAIHSNILSHKVRYPLLEYASRLMTERIAWEDQLNVCDQIMTLHENGCSVITGMMLQLRLSKGVDEPIQKAGEYMIIGDEWYVCDNLAERVMGHALLLYPEKTIPILKDLIRNENKWLVRSVGVATHYATKKGLKKKYADEMFLLLLSQSHITSFHPKTGIGWGAKTIVKFHPDIYEKYRSKIDDPKVRSWFKTKVKIGLGRSEKYAGRFE